MAETSVRVPAAGTPGPRPGDHRPERIPLSLQQEFLRLLDHGDGLGPFGPRYTIVGGWRVRGELDPGALQGALDDVVTRHETLRTSLVFEDGEPYQRIGPAAAPRLLVTDVAEPDPARRDRRAEELLNDVEAGPLPIDEMPLLRATVGRFDNEDSVLILAAHHTAVDGWSIHLVMRDLAHCYAARRGAGGPDLPPARQYREYVAWQRATADSAATRAARAFWRETLRGAQLVAIPTDRPRRPGEPFVTGWHRFLVDDELTAATLALADRMRSSPFMVLLAAYLIYLRDGTGATDLVVPTFTPGRRPSWVGDTVGSFYNFLPLRTDITGCTSLREVIARVRTACLAAYPHEIPFIQLADEAPELMTPVLAPDAAACVFQVTQSPNLMRGERIGELRYTAMRRRLVSAPVGSQIPDGALLGLELHRGSLVGSVGYTGNLFGDVTIGKMAADFSRVLRAKIPQ
jgi:hypothetical protein